MGVLGVEFFRGAMVHRNNFILGKRESSRQGVFGALHQPSATALPQRAKK
jgi:hypothetical protein